MKNDKHAPPRPASRLRRWLAAALSALERAERRIAKNFRVPPNGG